MPVRRISVTRPSGPPHTMPVALQHQSEGGDVDGSIQSSEIPQPDAASDAQSTRVPFEIATTLSTHKRNSIVNSTQKPGYTALEKSIIPTMKKIHANKKRNPDRDKYC